MRFLRSLTLADLLVGVALAACATPLLIALARY